MYTARNNDTPRQISRDLDVDLAKLLRHNAPFLPGLEAGSKLKPKTEVALPAGALAAARAAAEAADASQSSEARRRAVHGALARVGRPAAKPTAAGLAAAAAVAPPPLVLLSTGLEPADQKRLKTLAAKLGASVVKQWSADVTHVVCSTQCGSNAAGELGERLCGRTMKYTLGVLGGQWMVSSSWVAASEAAARWADEEAHEVQGDLKTVDAAGRGSNAPKLSRLNKARSEPGLFDGLAFALDGKLDANGCPGAADIAKLLHAGGAARVHEGLPRAHRPVHGPPIVEPPLVVVVDELDEAAYPAELVGKAAELGARIVPFTWLLDSVSHFALRPYPGEQESPSASQPSPVV